VICFYRILYGRHTIRALPKLEFSVTYLPTIGNNNMQGAQSFVLETRVAPLYCVVPKLCMMKYIQNISIVSHGILWVGE
jgi:hypothetical protein